MLQTKKFPGPLAIKMCLTGDFAQPSSDMDKIA